MLPRYCPGGGEGVRGRDRVKGRDRVRGRDRDRVRVRDKGEKIDNISRYYLSVSLNTHGQRPADVCEKKQIFRSKKKRRCGGGGGTKAPHYGLSRWIM